MNLPAHGQRMCIGLDLYGLKESCAEPVEDDSPFPFCKKHRVQIQQAPRKRYCSGAITYDAAMRPVRTECNNLTGDPELALCASCRIVEKREKERARSVFEEVCPHCGHRGPRRQNPVPQQQQAQRPYVRPRRPPQPYRPQSEPQRYTFNNGTPPYKDGDDE